jgi:hypothetical protein
LLLDDIALAECFMECNILLSRAARRKGFSPLSIVFGGVLCLAPQSGLHAEPAVDPSALGIAQNVVQVRTKSSAKSQDGFGFLFGERNGLLYIATANKLVRGSRGETDRSPSLVFSHSQNAPVRGRLLETSSPANGLAVIEVESARVPGLSWARSVVAATSSVNSGVSLWLVGPDRRSRVPSVPGKALEVTQVDRTDYAGPLIVAGGLTVVGGTAGAPLVSDNGMVGMIISDSNPQKVEAMPVENIEAVVRGWGYPWLLSFAQPKQDCDLFAASPNDLGRPADVAGVSLDKLDVKKAMGACWLLGPSYADKIPRFTYQVGRILQAEGDLQEAEKLYAIAANKGYPAAQSALGVLYEKQGKDKEAAELYRRSAEQRDPVGQTNFATMLRDEYGGVRKNDDEAARLYKEAASQNYPAALSSLGWMYEQGRVGSAANESEARRLYEKAAEGGDPYAQRALARLDSR